MARIAKKAPMKRATAKKTPAKKTTARKPPAKKAGATRKTASAGVKSTLARGKSRAA